ncbi:hypothetical protein HQ587_07630 [bacterium]|nr:hypothetical protein [bacterium]
MNVLGKDVRTYFWVFTAGVILLTLQIPLFDYIVDDAFIHLTFARNLAQGNGFAFNPGEPTYGSTAPLWTMILAFFSLLFTPGLGMAKALSIIFGLLTIPAFRLLAGNIGLTRKSADIATIVWAVNVWLVRWTASGMEATLATLLLLIAVNAQVRSKDSAGIWIGLTILCRPEAAVLAVIFALDRWHSAGFRQALKLCGIVVIVNLPWLIYALITFGTIIPNTALVKGGFNLPVFGDFLFGLKRTVLIIGSGHCLEVLVVSAGLLYLLIRGTKETYSANRTIALLSVWAVFPAVVYLMQGVFISSRYLLLGLPALTLLMFLFLDNWERRGKLHIWRWGRYLILCLLVIQQLFLTYSVTLPHVEAFKPTIEVLTGMAERLRNDTPPGSSVAVGDVGVIGFYSDRYVVDLEGLVTAEMIPYRVGIPLDELILSGSYLRIHPVDYIIDKSQNPGRLFENSPDLYQIIAVEPVPGGLIGTSHQQWYYTLYRIEPAH